MKMMIKSTMRMFSTGILCILFISGCSSWEWNQWPWAVLEKKGTRVIEWESVPPKPFPILTAVGYAPLEGQPGATKAQRMLMAMRASKIDAYRELLEQVYGQEIENQTTVRSWMGQRDEISVKISGVIRGARVVKSYQVGEHYVVEMELDFANVWNLYRQLNPERRLKSVEYF